MICQVGALSVYYERVGEGRPLVTLSGIPSDHRLIASWLEPIFAGRPGWQRLYFDLPGTGRTPAGGITTIEQVLDVAAAVIDQLYPAQPVTVVGLSAGGYVARGLAARAAERIDGLCLLVPWVTEADEAERPAPVVLARDPAALARLTPEDAAIVAGLAVVQSPQLVEWYQQVVRPARLLGEGLPLAQFMFAFDPEARPQAFAKPTLILAGRQDAHVGYRSALDLAQFYPRATVAALDRAGHALGIEQAGLFRALFNEWLDRVEAEAPLNG